MTVISKVFELKGLTCVACETRIEKEVSKLEGVKSVDVSYSSGFAKVTFDSSVTSIEEISSVIKKLHYGVEGVIGSGQKNKKTTNHSKRQGTNQAATDDLKRSQYFAIAAIVLGIALFFKNRIGTDFLPEINEDMGYLVLFIVGLITSVHCIAMCGGINLSQTLPKNEKVLQQSKFERLKPSLMYNAGRVISYTIIGGLVGAAGAVISISDNGKAIISLLAGVFMIIMGLNLLNVFPSLRKLNPRMPKSISKKVHTGDADRGPFIVGLLNGLMPCGPLQAMQIYALGTGSFAAGALSMFMFSLGTVPLMLGLGAISTVMTRKTMKKMMAAGAMLVITLGFSMFTRGLTLSGFAMPDPMPSILREEESYVNPATVEGDVQYVTTDLESGSYEAITVEAGVPVEWTIVASEETLNGCNNAIVIPEYGIQKALKPGENVITFTPTETGTFGYSCWMGMITSEIVVVDDLPDSASDSSRDDTVQSSSSDSNSDSNTVSAEEPSTFEPINPATIEGDVQKVTTEFDGGAYQPITVQVGIPVEWTIIIDENDITGCNQYMQVPEYSIGLQLQPGENTVAFTPTSTGSFTYTCSMGMITSQIVVVDDLSNPQVTNDDYYPPRSFNRGGGGGCCG